MYVIVTLRLSFQMSNRNRNRNSTRSALAACGIVLLVFAFNELRGTRTGCLIRTGFYGGRPRKEIAAQEWGPKTLVRGSEVQRGLDREGEGGRPFRIGGKEFERGGEEAVGAGWQAHVSAEGEMWLWSWRKGGVLMEWLMGWSMVGKSS